MSWSIISKLRGLLDRETGTVFKDWGGKIPVALAFPNVYRAGMSNLGFQAMYGLFNTWQDVVCERVFLPDKALAADHARTQTPLLSLESQRRLADFEMVAFSLSYENDYIEMLKMLNLARLPVRRADRSEADPLILAGGVSMRLNPEPLADFLDLVLIGDGEIQVPELLRAWREARSEPLPKKDRVFHLARSVPGAYAPEYYEAAFERGGRLKFFKPTRPDLPSLVTAAKSVTLPRPALSTQILTPQTGFSNTRLVEISRGCSRGCRFCLAGFAYRPPRIEPIQAVLDAIGPPSVKPNRVGLVSPAVTDHPRIEEIIRTLTGQGREVTVSSLRVEAITPGLAEALSLGRLRSAAIAPEAGSERLRAFINKGLTERQIIEGALVLAEAGVKRLKLYFMIGLPTETMDDIRAIADLVKKIKDRLRRAFRGQKLLPELTLSVSSFVPKAFTPFQTEPMAGVRDLKARAKLIQSDLRAEKGVKVHFDVPKWSYLQTLLSRGDRRVSTLIEALAQPGVSLAQALKQVAFNPDYFVTRPIEADELLPWSFIDHGFKPDYFSREMDKARQGKSSPPCRPETCTSCGICPLPPSGEG